MKSLVWTMAATVWLGGILVGRCTAEEGVVSAGAGGYVTALPAGGKAPQAEIFRTPNARGPMPTTDWWSSLAWMKFTERQYPHPLAVAAQPEGLRVFYPGNSITGNKDA